MSEKSAGEDAQRSNRRRPQRAVEANPNRLRRLGTPNDISGAPHRQSRWGRVRRTKLGGFVATKNGAFSTCYCLVVSGSLGKIETGNFVVILIGTGLVVSGPYIVYRTLKGMLEVRRANPSAPLKDLHLFSNGINFLIAILFFFAGILFIVNNLRGNPLG